MGLPSELSYVTVVGTIADVPTGAARAISLRCNEWLMGPTADLIVPPFSINPAVAADGTFTAQVPATDDPAWSPSGWAYRVLLNVDGKVLEGSLAVPTNTVGSLDIADALSPDAPLDPATPFLLAASRGAPGGVAGLDADGDVIDSDGNKVTGGGGGGGPSPSSTVAASATYGQSATAGAATNYSRGDHRHGTPAAPAWSDVTGKPSTFAPSLPIAQSGVTSLTADLAALDGRLDVLEARPAIITLATGAPVPGGTAAGTIIVRY